MQRAAAKPQLDNASIKKQKPLPEDAGERAEVRLAPGCRIVYQLAAWRKIK